MVDKSSNSLHSNSSNKEKGKNLVLFFFFFALGSSVEPPDGKVSITRGSQAKRLTEKSMKGNMFRPRLAEIKMIAGYLLGTGEKGKEAGECC